MTKFDDRICKQEGLLCHLPNQVITAQQRNHVYPQRGDTDAQNKILALLLHKSLEPIERNYALGLELANKLEELEEIEALKEDLELERELSSNTLAEDKSIPRKRGEPCFWKYCV
ncbi:urotensin 2 domain containing isoform X3 [Coregonus clupeaformis]|uniref:urotensin 2 domain containing isoform X3 n=1 Tax=Coregonus clupeaformis TaxID=59861 RepID=UPI001BE0970A|nr:urotensin 2 domain containing isoform X3 [Coregonus clupeaformis]